MNEVTGEGVDVASRAQTGAGYPVPATAARAPSGEQGVLTSRWRKLPPAVRSSMCFLCALAVASASPPASLVLHNEWAVRPVGVAGLGFAALLAFIGCYFALVTIVRASRTKATLVGALGVFAGLVLLAANGLMTLIGAVMALWATTGFARGRQLRRWGRVVLPALRPGDSWTSDVGRTIEVSAPWRMAVAAQWRENAKTEHASVAAFARLTIDLMALGAPADLLASAQRDALDEIRHAQICLSLASAIDGKPHAPAPFPQVRPPARLSLPRSMALASLATHSLVDGALHEGFSARVVARLARLAEPEPVRDALARIAADEGRHSAHGWHVVEWCVTEGGIPVLRALEGAARALPRTVVTPMPAGAVDGSWERWGLHGRSLEAECYAATRAYVVRRVSDLASRFAGDVAAVAA